MKIEIYEISTGKVVSTQRVKSLSDFQFYWDRQCDATKYAWRVAG